MYLNIVSIYVSILSILLKLWPSDFFQAWFDLSIVTTAVVAQDQGVPKGWQKESHPRVRFMMIHQAPFLDRKDLDKSTAIGRNPLGKNGYIVVVEFVMENHRSYSYGYKNYILINLAIFRILNILKLPKGIGWMMVVWGESETGGTKPWNSMVKQDMLWVSNFLGLHHVELSVGQMN